MITITDKVKDTKLQNHEDEMPEGEDIQDLELEEQEEMDDHATNRYMENMHADAERVR